MSFNVVFESVEARAKCKMQVVNCSMFTCKITTELFDKFGWNTWFLFNQPVFFL